MSNPANQAGASRRAAGLRRWPPRARQSIASLIWRRWQVRAYRWRLKHLRWYLTQATQSLSPSTRYRHWLTVRVLIQCLGGEDEWVPRLQVPGCVRAGHGE